MLRAMRFTADILVFFMGEELEPFGPVDGRCSWFFAETMSGQPGCLNPLFAAPAASGLATVRITPLVYSSKANGTDTETLGNLL